MLVSADGHGLSVKVQAELSSLDRVCLAVGRYEVVDERVADFLADRELSIGDYVLSGGEMAAAVIVEAVMRLLPGAGGNEASTQQESFTVDAKLKIASGADSTCGSNGLLEYPHSNRPADIPLSGVPEG